MTRSRILLLVVAAAAAWSLVVAITGGVVVNAPWGRMSSRDPMRAFAVAAIAALWYALRFGHRWQTDIAPVTRVTWPPSIAAVASILAFGVGVQRGTFVAGGPDPSGYVSQAEMWLEGGSTMHTPAWVDDARWPDAAWTSAPLGYCPGQMPHTLVPTYSPGLPMMMALFQAVGGRKAVYYVVPILGAAAVWATYLIGKLIAGAGAGALASVLMLFSPAFLVMIVQPMSDVPAAALWALAIVAAWRVTVTSALAAGALASLAVLTRPNLVPLAAIVALIVASGATDRRSRAGRLLAYSVAVAPSVIVIAILNAHWYGGPLRSGYGPLDYLYSLERIGPNLQRYGAWLLETQTPLIFLAALAPWVLRHNALPSGRLVLTTLVFPLAVLALYVAYLVFDGWFYLRFLLPAYPMLLAAAAAVLLWLCTRMKSPARSFLVTALVAGAVTSYGAKLTWAIVFGGLKETEHRYLQAANYARSLLRPAVVATLHHSGSVHYYTNHDVLRWDFLDPAYIDGAIGYLRGRGFNVYLFIEPHEVDAFHRRFTGQAVLEAVDHTDPVELPGNVRVYPLGGTERPPDPAPMQSIGLLEIDGR